MRLRAMHGGEMKRYWCYYTNCVGYDYEAFAEERDDGEWIKYDDHAALLAAVAEEVRKMEHEMECEAFEFDADDSECNCSRGRALALLEGKS